MSEIVYVLICEHRVFAVVNSEEAAKARCIAYNTGDSQPQAIDQMYFERHEVYPC